MHEQCFRIISSTGLLAPGSSPRGGMFNTEPHPAKHQGLGVVPPESARETLDKIHHSKEYQDFVVNPGLREWVRRIMRWEKEVCHETWSNQTRRSRQ